MMSSRGPHRRDFNGSVCDTEACMTRPIGNVRLKAARQHAGYGSQQALADALTRAAPQLGLGHLEISDRQIRRWESASPPWPRADHQRLLVHVLQLPVEELGFTPPW